MARVQAALEIGDAMRAFSNREMYYGRGPSFTHCYGPHPAIVRHVAEHRLLRCRCGGGSTARLTTLLLPAVDAVPAMAALGHGLGWSLQQGPPAPSALSVQRPAVGADC